jgi:hypothetical protein
VIISKILSLIYPGLDGFHSSGIIVSRAASEHSMGKELGKQFKTSTEGHLAFRWNIVLFGLDPRTSPSPLHQPLHPRYRRHPPADPLQPAALQPAALRALAQTKHDLLAGKALIDWRTNKDIYEYLNRKGVKTHYLSSPQEKVSLVKKLDFKINLEVVSGAWQPEASLNGEMWRKD